MSTNDDSASRRGRRAGQGESDWRTANRQHPGDGWDQQSQGNRDSGNPYPGQKARENQPQQAAYSGYTRQSYSQQSYPQPPQDLPPPQQPRPFEPPQLPQNYYPEPVQHPRALEPQQPPQSYHQEPRQDFPRSYVDPVTPYSPPPAPYESGAQHMPYGGTGSDLFGGGQGSQGFEQNAYEQDPYGVPSSYRPDPYEPAQARPPMMQPATPRREEPDYPQREDERLFAARIAQEGGASRFYLSDEQPQRPAQPERSSAFLPPQAPADPRFAPSQPYNAPGYDQHGAPDNSYGRDHFDSHFPAQDEWRGDEHGFHDDEVRGGRLPQAVHGDEYDEEFPDEDFDGDDYASPRTGGRKKLVLALFASAVVVAVGGAYAYKTLVGPKGERATPLIQADRTPSKEIPGNPGGRQFPHGEKAIYERLTPDGRTQVASFTPAAAPPVAPALTASAGGTSLEDRIDEALKKAQSTGDAPAASAPSVQSGGPGTDQPTVVRSESYRPDGTRVDSRPVITPSIVSVENGLPYPFGNATAPAPATQAQPGPFMRPAPPPAQPQFSTAMAPAPVRTASRTHQPAEAAALPAGGFYVSLKSAPDERAIQRDLPALTEKYKSVLGDVQLAAKIADLGAKGVTYRAVAGPLGTRQEALELCEKIKGVGGSKACFVTN
ncbi:MAG: SPOR domain-containing protein [Rhodomicrobium sp.]